MKPFFIFFSIFFVYASSTVFLSCAGKPATPLAPPQITAPPIPVHIMGQGQVGRDDMARFLLASNKEIKTSFVSELADFYIKEASAEGVNHDVAFSQMCLETGYLRFGNLVTPDMNNFCGLGSIGADHPGERFSDPQTGVRAHIQHLKAYATEETLKQTLVDPRYKWVKKGSAPTIQGLAGKWASDPDYAAKINSVLTRLYDQAFADK
jgi:hypothetical protein